MERGASNKTERNARVESPQQTFHIALRTVRNFPYNNQLFIGLFTKNFPHAIKLSSNNKLKQRRKENI
ncbi:CLUMA_CG008301, isoform A [Clunio marinus]|uniref:CLUMA_CG008301, isoform A n=1 Tax=Clunio marinus TaxID=568069 RepID=A0A1J1I399_9DIPT|nr:CLUMA_CG008301, isoform A [Clunio marinus]